MRFFTNYLHVYQEGDIFFALHDGQYIEIFERKSKWFGLRTLYQKKFTYHTKAEFSTQLPAEMKSHIKIANSCWINTCKMFNNHGFVFPTLSGYKLTFKYGSHNIKANLSYDGAEFECNGFIASFKSSNRQNHTNARIHIYNNNDYELLFNQLVSFTEKYIEYHEEITSDTKFIK